MRRRDFIAAIAGAATAWPLAGRAQQSAMPVIGFLGSTPSGPYAGMVAAIRQGLKEIGFIEGQNLTIEYRWADNQLDRLPALATDLVNRKVALIVTSGSVPPARAAKTATSTIPIVFHMGADPVATGIVSNINRPGGNITGVSFLTVASASKRLGLLREMVPALNVVGVLFNSSDPTAQRALNDFRDAAGTLGITLHFAGASTEREIDDALAALAQRKVGGLIANTEPFFRTRMDQIIGLTTHYAMPDMYTSRDYCLAGGLMAYGASIAEAYRQQGVYAGKILKGEKPGDLPVMQSAKFDFVLNLRAARRLGLTPSAGLISIVDEVIE